MAWSCSLTQSKKDYEDSREKGWILAGKSLLDLIGKDQEAVHILGGPSKEILESCFISKSS